MRKETKTVVTAFLAGKAASATRTKTNGTTLFLHDNAIAWKEKDGTIAMTLAGWPTPTTRERLNGLCELAIGKRPFSQEHHDQRFNGDFICASDIVSIYPVLLHR